MAIDSEGQLVAANSLFCSLLGMEEHKLPLGQRLLDHWPCQVEDRPALASFLRTRAGALEVTINRPSGQDMMVRLSHRIIREADAFPELRFFSVMESANHEDVLEALRYSEERFKAVTEAVSDHVLELDESGNITFSSVTENMAKSLPFSLSAGDCQFAVRRVRR